MQFTISFCPEFLSKLLSHKNVDYPCQRYHCCFSTHTAAYMKHIKTCQHNDQRDTPHGKQHLMSKNPLLSLTIEDQPYDNDYHCGLYEDQSNVEMDHNHNDNNIYHDDDDRSCQSSVSSVNQYYLINNFSEDDHEVFSNLQPSQFDAAHKFQVKLHNLIIMHRASLQMFDDICHLISNYTLSPDQCTSNHAQSKFTDV